MSALFLSEIWSSSAHLSAEHHELDSSTRVLFRTEPEHLRGTVGQK